MSLKKKALTTFSVVLILGMAILGILAYLTSTDNDVNVMTLGEVSIKQIEQQEKEDGSLEPFIQDKALYPGTEISKIVTVENTGKSDCYFRTLIAFEEIDSKTFEINFPISDGYKWSWGAPEATIEIEGVTYQVYEAVYQKALPAGTTSTESLTKVELSKESTNEDMEALGGTYEILVLSQAVQVEGFDSASVALDAAFGDVDDPRATAWFKEVLSKNTKDIWDGTADTSWYNDADTEFVITTAEQLAGFAELVDGGNTFAGKTVKLGKDVDLYLIGDNGEPVSFDPIGDNSPFAGTFDGQGNTISNLYQSGWAFGYEWGKYGSIGLFSELENATVKNLTISGAETLIEGGDVGGITGSATGTCVFEDITIENSKIATYNNGLGGIIGWSGAGNYTFKNITIDEDTVLAGLWGSFDSSIGGVVGQGEPGATYDFENVDIACRIDAYNDCTASYDYYNYRMCGMIIGRLAQTTTIDGVNYPDVTKYNITCKNVDVTYGEWHNYHYCDPTPGYNGGRGMRVEPGYSYDGLPDDYDHSQCTTHHNELIPFDQIFGGDQLGVKGLKTYDGVTVKYPN